jgi:hypothetical protein
MNCVFYNSEDVEVLTHGNADRLEVRIRGF